MNRGVLTCITIRYSLMYRSGRSWRIGRENDPEKYRKKLFDPARLASRRFLFETLTLPSLDLQRFDPCVHRVQVLTSRTLPELDRSFLERLSASRDWMEVIDVDDDTQTDPYQQAFEAFIRGNRRPSGRCISVRLDDDDALACDFVDVLTDIALRYDDDIAISLARGALLPFDEARREFGSLYQYDWPFGSVGLAVAGHFDVSGPDAQIPNCILRMGNHLKIAERVPVVVDCRTPAFIRTVFASQDMAGKDARKIDPDKELSLAEAERILPDPRFIKGLGKVSYDDVLT